MVKQQTFADPLLYACWLRCRRCGEPYRPCDGEPHKPGCHREHTLCMKATAVGVTQATPECAECLRALRQAGFRRLHERDG